jgi:hypothetical protein
MMEGAVRQKIEFLCFLPALLGLLARGRGVIDTCKDKAQSKVGVGQTNRQRGLGEWDKEKI